MRLCVVLLACLTLLGGACREDRDQSAPLADAGHGAPDAATAAPAVPWPEAPGLAGPPAAFAGRCLAVQLSPEKSFVPRWLATDDAQAYQLAALEGRTGVALRFHAADLGVYLLWDAAGRYVALEEGRLVAAEALAAPPLEGPLPQGRPAASRGEWQLEEVAGRAGVYRLRNLGADRYLEGAMLDGRAGDESADELFVTLHEAEGCAEHPELSLDAVGEVQRTGFEDGDVFGIVDTHSHVFANLGFGPGVHGAPFHRLGVAHALGDCTQAHGPEGRQDLWGYFADGGEEGGNAQELIATLAARQTPEFNHHTDGWPSFTQWPAAPFSSTHQTQYWRWLERAWMGGLRLMVMHAVGNEVICHLQRYLHPEPERFVCNEMRAVEASLVAAREMERYIDAQFGGEGRGFFKVVTSPAEAREAIGQGKLAVVLGIETSNLFDCFLTARPGVELCSVEEMLAALDRVHALGVRVMFPVHKFDNGFSAGDGHRGVIELANFINSGQWSSFVQDCEVDGAAVFDRGDVAFGGFNQPRQDYHAPAVADMRRFPENPLAALRPHLARATEGPLLGEYCQSHGITALGERLLEEMMRRGMIIELDHFPKRSYARAVAMLEARRYPGAAGTHGEHFGGRLYRLGGVSKTSLGRCHDPENPQAVIGDLSRRVALRREAGQHPGEGLGLDLNGFAGYPGPRFGERSRCQAPQQNPVVYPFASFGGDVTFTPPMLGERAVDFNTEGLVHIGLLPELVEDARRSGATAEELEPLFRSAEAYLRMWEQAEARAQELREER